MPNMKSFARAASDDERVSKNEDAIYSQFKRASQNQQDVIGIMGRPSKGVDTLQLHAFARQASENVWLRFIVCGTQSLKLIDYCMLKNLKVASRRLVWLFSTNLLQLNRAIPEKRKSPAPLSKTSAENSKRRSHTFLTTTKAILTSTDRMDATAVNIMEGYYVSIDDLCEKHPELDEEPTRLLNFAEALLNNRGEYEKKDI
jgi:hypothetical protein